MHLHREHRSANALRVSRAKQRRRSGRCVLAVEVDAVALADVLVRQDQVRDAAIKLAAEIGENSPLGLIATRMTMRGGIADRVREATNQEPDFKEGVKSMSERRVPDLISRDGERRVHIACTDLQDYVGVIRPLAVSGDAWFQDLPPRWRRPSCAP